MNSGFDIWREQRQVELAAPESWLGLIGLFWLEPGSNAVGTAGPVRLPEGPARLGMLDWQGASLVWRPAEGEAVVLHTDRVGEPTRVTCGQLAFFVIERDGRLALRLRDLAWRDKRHFAGVACFPFDPDWCLEAKWQVLAQPMELQIQTMTGDLKIVPVRHRAVFVRDGMECALLPLEDGDEGVFFVFRDQTAGKETYGGGRFLRAPPARDGRILLDFNRAYNPPCAFTPFAACPLPPPENRLPFPVMAGEKRYADEG